MRRRHDLEDSRSTRGRFFTSWAMLAVLSVGSVEAIAQGGGQPPKPNKPKPEKPPPPDPPNDGKAPKPDAPDKPDKPTEPDRFPGLSRHGERLDQKEFGRRPETPPRPLAVDPRLKWGIRLDAGVRAAALLDGRNVFTATEAGTFSAHSLQDGAVVWSATMPSGASTRGVLIGERWVVPLKNGELVAIDAANGAVKNSSRAAGPIEAPLGIDVAGNRIVVATAGGELVAVDAGTFAITSRFPGIPGLRLGAPLVSGDRAWVADSRGMVRWIDLSSGRALWEQQLFGAVAAPLVLVPGAAPLVVAGTLGGEVFALDGKTGREVWKASGYAAFVGACVRNAEIIAVFANQRLFRLDSRTGRVIEDRTLRDLPRGAPLVAGSTLLVPCSGGRLESFDSTFRSQEALLLGSEVLDLGGAGSAIVLTTESGDLYRLEGT